MEQIRECCLSRPKVITEPDHAKTLEVSPDRRNSKYNIIYFQLGEVVNHFLCERYIKYSANVACFKVMLFTLIQHSVTQRSIDLDSGQ